MRINTILFAGAALICAQPAAATAVFVYTGSFQTYVVPITGEYAITAFGAHGGNTSEHTGGRGAGIGGTVALTAGDTLDIAVGGHGASALTFAGAHKGAGGGGATWVYDNLYTPLVVAAGGGGAGSGVTGVAPGVDYAVFANGYDGKSNCCFVGAPINDPAGTGGASGASFAASLGHPQQGGGGGGAGAFGAGGDGALGGGQGGGEACLSRALSFPKIAPGGGPEGYGGFGGGGGGDAFGAGGGGGGYSGGDGGSANNTAQLLLDVPPYSENVYVGPYGSAGFGGQSAFLGDALASACSGCQSGDGAVSITYVLNSGPGGFSNPPPGVPEPETWTLMLLGVGFAGATLRSDRRRAALLNS